MFSRRLPHTREPNEWSRRLAARRAAGQPVLDLTDQNPTRTGLSEAADALAMLADPRAARYEPDPRGLRSARDAVAAYYAGRGVALAADDVVLCSGTSEAYSHLFRALCDPDDRVLVPAPGYPLLEPLAALDAIATGTYTLDEAGGWRPDVDAIAAALDERTRVVVLVQPHHPTGACCDAAELAALDAVCAARGVAVIADEVFGDFGWAGALPCALGDRAAATFVLQGLSKLCGLPQLKLSWIAVAGPADVRARAIEALEWVADAYLTVGGPVQHALPELLERRHAFRDRVLARVRANRDALAAALAGCGARVLPAAGGWTALVRLPDGVGADALSLALLARGVAVHPGHFYDLDDDAHLVVSLVVTPEVMAEGAASVAAVVRAS